MPVLSPHRSSASALAGSYRSTFSSSSTIDRPYFNSTSYNPRITSYSERYTTRSYTDSDGRRLFSRSGSVTEDGITSRFREEGRESSVRRDSLSRDNSAISSIRENSITEFPRRDSSVSRTSTSDGGRLSTLNVHDSVAELRNKYSPANYVPACLRERNENISRSKSINDIGLPPIESIALKPASSKKKVTSDGLNYNNSTVLSNSNTTNNDNGAMVEDDNGNRTPSVADLKKRFDDRQSGRGARNSSPQPELEGVRIAENHFKKQDRKGGSRSRHAVRQVNDERQTVVVCQASGDEGVDVTKLEVNCKDTAKNGLGEEEGGDLRKNGSRVNNFASYIPARDYQLKECTGEEGGGVGGATVVAVNGSEERGEEGKTDYLAGKRFSDISTSPKLSSGSGGRSVLPPSAGGAAPNSTSSSSLSNSLSRRSTDRAAAADAANNTNNSSNSYEPSSHRYLNSNNSNNNTNNSTSNGSPTKSLGLNGLKNIGNTCFMNSVIQCLSNTRLLLEYLVKESYAGDVNTATSSMKGALIRAFAEVIRELWSEDAADRVVNTSSLKSQIQRFAPRFIGYAQQDAQEFLRYLLEGLHEDVNRVKEKPRPIVTEIDEKLSDSEKSSESWSRYLRMDNSKIVDYFVGQLKSTLKCTHCGHCSVTFDPFWDLSLPIPQRAGQVRLAQCLDSFTREETLDGDEKPTCSKCKERRKCTKSFTIQKFPKILVIHLKRFSLAERFRGKLSVTVDFPLEGLDMSHYAADHVTPCRYNLYAISNHSGTTYSGHYTAYCRHPYTKSWHEYNDSRVSPISSKSIVSGEAYVLFYEQEGQKSHL